MRHRRPTVFVVALLLLLTGCSANSLDAIRLTEDLRERDSRTLVDAAAGGSSAQQLAAVRAMGRIQSPDYADALAQAARSETKPLRIEALFALGQLGLAEAAVPPDAARQAVAFALTDPDAIAKPWMTSRST